jgi:hypothetical protein|tara:strand:+ start:71 stop:316 length:246 start_codon:yes stop_codon:yes gene_type:complete
MGGQIRTPQVRPGEKGGTGTPKKDKPDLSVAEGPTTGPKGDFGLTNLGESKPQTDEGIVTTVGSTPVRKKKPTITLLGEKP